MSDIKLQVTNLNEFQTDLQKSDAARIKAGRDAVKIEGYRLFKLLRAEIKAGDPGGQAFSPLSEIAQHRFEKGGTNRNALRGLMGFTRYAAAALGQVFTVSDGFFDAPGKSVSDKWLGIAQTQQTGFIAPVTPELREMLNYWGIVFKKQGKPWANVFFLKKTTTTLKTPARDIIDPFWAAHQAEAQVNILANFEKKLRGEWVK